MTDGSLGHLWLWLFVAVSASYLPYNTIPALRKRDLLNFSVPWVSVAKENRIKRQKLKNVATIMSILHAITEFVNTLQLNVCVRTYIHVLMH